MAAHLTFPARSKPPAVRSAEPREEVPYPLGVEPAVAEVPLTSEPPLPEAEPLTSEPPLTDASSTARP
ncbi:hypothetical protein [Streptomyces sp. YIM S03343]